MPICGCWSRPKPGGVVCHVGIYRRDVKWNGRKVWVGGIGGVLTREDCRRHGYASIALNAAIQTLKHEGAADFAMLFCEPHNEAFYEARGWHPFEGEVYAEQPEGRIRFEAMAPYVFDITREPRDGVSSTYAACPGDPCTAGGWRAFSQLIICQP